MDVPPTAAQRISGPPRRAWEENKGTIKDFYITQKNRLKDVMRIIGQGGFIAEQA